MKTWRGISRHTLQTTRFTRLASTQHKPANIATLLKSAAESTQSGSPEIQVKGYVRTIRKQKRIAFAAIEDGSSLQPIQAVLTPDQAQSYVEL
jgi:asparaginyl-tRNA synthetase